MIVPEPAQADLGTALSKRKGVDLGTLPSRVRPIPLGRTPKQICSSMHPSTSGFRKGESKAQGSVVKEFLSKTIRSLHSLIA